eukprot:UN05694
MKYPEETAGALMTSDFLVVNQNANIESIIKQFRQFIEEDQVDEIHFIYVANKKNVLLGYIPVKNLILENLKLRQKKSCDRLLLLFCPIWIKKL